MSLAAAIKQTYPEAFGIRLAESILKDIADAWGYRPQEITAPNRKRSLVSCRRAIVLELRKQGLSWSEIGAVMNRHHTTCMHLAGQR